MTEVSKLHITAERRIKICLFVSCCLWVVAFSTAAFCQQPQKENAVLSTEASTYSKTKLFVKEDGVPGPRIELPQDCWDFGQVEKGQTKQKVFLIKNAGTEKLMIGKIHTCCGYTVSDISSWEIQAGNQAEVKIVCDSTAKAPGKDEKFITIDSNDAITPKLKIAISADIVEGASETADLLKFQKVMDTTTPTQEMYPLDIETPVIPLISSTELHTHISKGQKVVLLDVREKNEFSEKHIPNAINFPKSRFMLGAAELRGVLEDIDKTSLIAVYCGGGFRSSYITRKIRELGYNAFNLEGGITCWEKIGFALVRGPARSSPTEPLRINLEEAYEHYFLLFKDNVVWIDLRSREDYKEGHIKGAINIPVYVVGDKLNLIPKDKETVLYCDGTGCENSASAGRFLIKIGYKQARIKVFDGGYSLWSNSGYPVQKNQGGAS